jgi:hypothetical protein
MQELQPAMSTQGDEDAHDHHRHEDVNPYDETIPYSSSSEEKRTSYRSGQVCNAAHLV